MISVTPAGALFAGVRAGTLWFTWFLGLIAWGSLLLPADADTILVPSGSLWKYSANGVNQGTAWRAAAYNDSGWPAGPAKLGYGDGNEATVIPYGPNASAKYITSYFRHSFEVANPAQFGSLLLRLVRDDGAVVYLNGVEVARSNLPAGTISYGTLASAAVADGADESLFHQWNLSSASLVSGTNCLAVEIHQSSATSSDLGFDLSLAAAPPEQLEGIVASGSLWKYRDNGSYPGANWVASGYNDSSWSTGPAQLGYGEGDEATVVGFGPSSTSRYITTWFRQTFPVTDPSAFEGLKLRLLRDDGAVVYLNGVEIHRSNMPSGAISATTLAPVAVGDAAESTWYDTTLPNTLLAGPNVLAVEIHQQAASSSDVSFDLQLLGFTSAPVVQLTRGPYLQKATPQSMVVRWRTDSAIPGTVRYGSSPGNFTASITEVSGTTEHQVELTGLLPATRYFYSVETGGVALAEGADFSFLTPPVAGSRQKFRAWVLGDSGTANANAAAVRNAYAAYTAGAETHVWMMLGDNAYNNGTDAEFQAAVFDMYPAMLRRTALWSTLGNHEYYTQQGSPYFDLHTFPTQGEAGGQPSGTEKYYSFDYANAHFICLDSMSSDRSASGAMAQWLQADLESTVQDWIIAFWHHPPYTFGSHNSDNPNGSDAELAQMRQNFLPLLEAGGVDLVMGGHSHSYERSWLINGHYGLSGSFQPSMKLDAGNGRENPDGSGVYQKPAGLPANQGAIYAVAGSSGKATNWWGGSTASTNPNPHPAMVVSLLKLGSLVLDVEGPRMDVKFLGHTGIVEDQFTLRKESPASPPVVQLLSPADGAVVNLPVTISASAVPAEVQPGGAVIRVDFYDGPTLLGSVSNPDEGNPGVWSFQWANAAPGIHALTAEAWDSKGAYAVSGGVTVTVNAPPSALITSPGSGQSFTAPANITVQVAASDPDGSITEVKVYVGGAVLATLTESPWQVDWPGVSAGDYELSAVVTDGAGLSRSSPPVSISVFAPNQAPQVQLVRPASSDVWRAPADVLLEASAMDSDGTVATVEFHANGAKVAVASAPDAEGKWTAVWQDVPEGTWELTATAVDNAGSRTVSVPVSIAVAPAPNTAPAVAVTGPASGASFKAGASVVIEATASDTDGSIAQVLFRVGSTVLGEDRESPFSISWDTVAPGSYLVTAEATDDDGATTLSAGVEITVLANQAPSVTLTSPASAATYAAPAVINLSATASDVDGTIALVRFRAGSNILIQDSSAPYQYTWSGVVAGTYTLTAEAVDNDGAVTQSSSVSVTVTAPPPAAPASLKARASGKTAVILSWTDRSNNEQGFAIERSSNNINFAPLGTTVANVVTYTDSSGLQPNTTYYYRVRAYTAGQQSAWSNTISVKTAR